MTNTSLSINGGLEDNAIVFNIQRYSIHDGPGIRTLVFMKECPLRCIWCDNPESWNPYPELSYRENRCIDCGKCIEQCPVTAIEHSNRGKIIIDRKLCNNCGNCASVCPSAALEMIGWVIGSEELLSQVKLDEVFYINSGGGITVSGGEPILQHQFLKTFLKKCKSNHLHTAIETCGYVPWKNMEKVMEFTDLILFDLKHMDTEKHKQLTGKPNDLILDNLRRISLLGKPIIIRVPLVPNYNDEKENFVKMVKFLKDLDNVQKIELLSYHNLGMQKYENLGRTYALSKLSSPTREKIRQLQLLIENSGITCLVG